MRRAETSLHELKSGMTKFPQTLVNVRMERRVDVTSLPAVRDAMRDAESALAGDGRILLRPSGTEPLLRVMVEGADRHQVELVAQQLASVVERALMA
jgi:phosphoglucosamine mutase